MAESEIVSLQTGQSQPQPPGLAVATNLLLPPDRTQDRLAHFPEEVYDLTAESHLVRFLKVLLGDAGAGQLRKRVMLTRMAQALHGTHFYDLDRFYGALFDAKRGAAERLALNPYMDTATADEWDTEHAKDASYRSRVTQLARAVGFGATPTGMELAAEAVLAVDCDVYESYTQADASFRTYGEIEESYASYEDMEGVSYGELEGSALQRMSGDERRVFVVRPKRQITQEEAYALFRVLDRLKPADSRCVIEWQGVSTHDSIGIRNAWADSEHWEVVAKVGARPIVAGEPYQSLGVDPVEQPRPPFSGYQGEAWSYNGDVVGVAAYHYPEGSSEPVLTHTQRMVFEDGTFLDFADDQAILPQRYVSAGRAVSDGVLVAHPYAGPRTSRRSDYIDTRGQVWRSSTPDRSILSPLFADRIPLDALADVVKRLTDADPFRQSQAQRLWATPERVQSDATQEVLELRFATERLVNYITFETAHFPHLAVAQVYDDQHGEWVEVYRRAVTNSLPKVLHPGKQVRDGHPQHVAVGHWLRCNSRIEPRVTTRFRVVLQRGLGTPPLLPRRPLTTGSYVSDQALPYSLALRNIDLGYRVTSRADLPDATVIGTTTDVLGSLVQFEVRECPASGLAVGKLWRSEPQPFNYAVVSLYLDVRDEAGEGVVIDRFHLDPVHPGPHITLYWSDAPSVSDYDLLGWTPVPRDYVLQKGYLHLPPTKARFWKLEFTNLVVEPYEVLVPINRQVRMFPPGVVSVHEGLRRGVADEALPPGVGPAMNVAGVRRYQDAVQAVNELASDDRRYEPTAALHSRDPGVHGRLRDLSWVYGFMPWHLGTTAPRFPTTQVHQYDSVEVRHTAKVGFFVGLNSIEAVRVDYQADDNTVVYVEHFWDANNIAETTWNMDPNKLWNGANIGAEATSKPLPSRHNVSAVQFATTQTPPVQVVPDHDFLDPALTQTNWTDPDAWHRVGDAQLLYSVFDNTVLMKRVVAPVRRAIEHIPGLPRPVIDPAFRQETFTIEDEEAEQALFGGIESPPLTLSSEGRVYAAVRFTLESDLTNPLLLQIVAVSNGTVLVEKEIGGHQGEMIEEYVGYDIGSFYVPPPPPVLYANRSGILDRLVQHPFTDEPPDMLPPPPPVPVTADGVVRVRLIQRGKSDDLIRVDTLSLFDEGIIWEFSVNGGNDWYRAKGIRNNADGVLVFPEPGRELVWRVRAARPNMTVSSLRIRPWYLGVDNARDSGAHRGPNVSVFDHIPPIHSDPEFTTWRKPIPQSWFYAGRRLPSLTPVGAPSITPYARFYARVAEDVVTPSDSLVRGLGSGRLGYDDLATADTSDRQGVFGRTVAESIGGDTDDSARMVVFDRALVEDSTAVTDSADAVVIPG